MLIRVSFLYISLVIAFCLFGIIYLSTYQFKRNRYIILIFSALILAQVGLMFENIEDSNPLFTRIFNPGFFLWIGPSLYFFTKQLVSIKSNPLRRFLHFIPGLVFFICFLIFPIGKFEDFINNQEARSVTFIQVSFFISICISYILYAVKIIRLVKYNREKIKNEYAETSLFLSLNWLVYFIWGQVTIFLIGAIVITLSRYVYHFSVPFIVIEILFLLNAVSMCYFSFRQPNLYTESEEESTSGEILKVENSSKPLLEVDSVAELEKNLTTYFDHKKPYLDQDVRMPAIAKQLNVTPNELSWFLNEHHKMNFFSFINQYRVQYAAHLISDREHDYYTLEAISKMSGFRSKTTFNNRFKETFEITPSAYRKLKIAQ